MFRIGPLGGTVNAGIYVSDTLSWIKAAGNPYYDWFFPDPLTCDQFLQMSLENPRSELHVRRIQALRVGPQIAGGFIALRGEDLRTCRMADAKCLIARTGTEQRKRILMRLALSEGLFLPVSSDEYYLSKIGVNDGFKGRGYGSLLMEMYLQHGMQAGFDKYRLDVAAVNDVAIKCYEKFGFKVTGETTTRDRGLRYLSMTFAC